MRKFVPIVLLLVVVLAVMGCSETREINEKAADDAEVAEIRLKEAWQQETGEAISGNTTLVAPQGMSESHQVMASMILMGQGMDADLSTYPNGVYLVEFKDAAGVERAAVFVDGKIVLPANAGE